MHLIQMIMIIILAEERNVSRVIAVIVLENVKVTLLFRCAVYVYVRFMEKFIIGIIDSTQSLRESICKTYK